MATETAYLSQFSYQLYDTSGTTDDYIYGALGGFSYTPEIGKVEFHPRYTTGFIPGVRRPAGDRRVRQPDRAQARRAAGGVHDRRQGGAGPAEQR